MNISFVIAVLCVLGLSVGQILFKFGANSMAENGINVRSFIYILSAIAIYMTQTIAWIWALKHESLGKIYPVMAFAFILIPLASIYFFKESFSTNYWIGVFLIVAGIAISTRSMAS